MTNDYIVRAMAENGAVRAFAATTKETVQTAHEKHNTSPTASAALGRMLTAAAMMGSMLKGEKDIVTLQIRGNGPLQGIVATSDSRSRVKGYVFEPRAEVPPKYPGKLDVAAAIGEGKLSVIRDIGLKEPYAGSIELVSGEIAEDLTYYFVKSEQTPSSVALGVLVDVDGSIKQSGGFLIQLMPEAPEDFVNKLEQSLLNLPPITDLLDQNKTPEEILELLLGKDNLTITDKIPVEFYCNCSRERVEKALISIGEKELNTIYEEDKGATLHCHFCGKEYRFEEADLKKLIQEVQS